MEPVRISIIGIDGSGKSTTALRAIHSLSHQFPICKTGRGPFFVWKGDISPCLPKTSNFFENLFKRVDATKKRGWIGMTRLLFVFFQGWLEPHMIKKYVPKLIVSTRCMVIDPAIYSDFYYPKISQKMSVKAKLKLCQRYARLPFRDLYFFLNTPIQMAMERIYRRLSTEHPEITYGRDYWLHLHEHEVSLQFLDQKFRDTLGVAQKMASFRIVEIDTAKYGETEVSGIISEYSLLFCKGGLCENWIRI